MLAQRRVRKEDGSEIIAGLDREFDKIAIPAIILRPEIVSVGLDPEAAKERGEDGIVKEVPARGR